MTATLASSIGADPRFKVGAYITNGTSLYQITGEIEEPTQRVFGARVGAPLITLEAENCATECRVQLDVNNVRRGCKLVKAAPSAACPDAYES